MSCVDESNGAMAFYLLYFHDIDTKTFFTSEVFIVGTQQKPSVAFTFIVICSGTGDRKEEEVRINKSIKFPFSRP